QHLNPGSPLVSSQIQGLSQYFLLHGYSLSQSLGMAEGRVFSQLAAQAEFLSYLDNFRFFALFFIPFILLVFFMRKLPKQKRGG
ncbi:MAG: hypothetical protein M1169_00190, partial [Firmicutes bacterium]|nr:hypothetical protein [Bacillota bacterium]